MKEALWAEHLARLTRDAIFNGKAPAGDDETMLAEVADKFFSDPEKVRFANQADADVTGAIFDLIVAANRAALVLDTSYKDWKHIDKKALAKVVRETRAALLEVSRCCSK